MLDPPANLDRKEIASLMWREFGAPPATLAFQPVGEDSWCFRYGEYWLSLRRDLRGHFPLAYAMASALRDQGLGFVLAPLAAPDGKIVRKLSCGNLIVYPYLELQTCEDMPLTSSEASMLVDMFEAVHASRPLDGLPEEDFGVSFLEDIDAAIAAAERAQPVQNGPISGRLHRLLQHNLPKLTDLRARYFRLSEVCRAASGPWCITHGEPIAANIVRHQGTLMVCDWGDAALGPPERDWAHLRRTTCARPRGRSRFMEFYETRWQLSEIAEYASILLAPHAGSSDDEAMYLRLTRYLPDSER